MLPRTKISSLSLIPLIKRTPEAKDYDYDSLYIKIARKKIISDEVQLIDPSLKDYVLSVLGREPELIVDIGSGQGEEAYGLARLFDRSEVVGIDTSDTAIGSASSNFNRDNLSYKRCDVEELDSRYKGIDLIMSYDSLHHFDDIDKALKSISKASNKDSLMILQDISRNVLGYKGIYSDDKFQVIYGTLKHNPKNFFKICKSLGCFSTDMETMDTLGKMSAIASYTPDEIAKTFLKQGYSSNIFERPTPDEGMLKLNIIARKA